jgi:predicted permease
VRRLFRLAVRRPVVTRSDADDELDLFLAERIDSLIARGMTPADAREEALRRLGAPLDQVRASLHRSAARRENRLALRDRIADWRDDLRYVARGLRRQPAFTIAAVACLAIGIGAITTMFGVVDSLLLRPPTGVRDPDHLLFISSESTDLGMSGVHGVPYPDYLDFSHSGSLTGAAAYAQSERSFGRGALVRQIRVLTITSTFMPLLGAAPVLGRFFTPDDDRGDGPAVVILSHAFWREQFGGASDVLGKSVRIRTRSYLVIGVAPRGFNGVDRSRVDAYLPLSAGAWEVWAPSGGDPGPADLGPHGFWFQMLARPRGAVRIEALTAELSARFHRADGDNRLHTTARVVVTPLADSYRKLGGPTYGQSADVSRWLGAVSVLVLLIACANVASLLLTRAVRRRRELAIRLTLGIGRPRLVRLLLTESLLLAILGGAAGVVIALSGGAMIRRWLLSEAAVGASVLDPRVLGVTLIVTLVTGLACGLAPALWMTRPDLAIATRAANREGTEGRGRLLSSLLVGQVAVTAVLLVGAGLFASSLRNLGAIDLGVDADRVLFAVGDFPAIGYSPERTDQLFTVLLDRVRALPGVERAALATAGPFVRMAVAPPFIPGREPERVEGLPPLIAAVSPEFFGTLGMAMVKGRPFTAMDRLGGPRVTVVNEAMARHYWPATDPMGQCVKIGGPTMPCATVVGIVTTTGRLLYPFDPLDRGPPIQAYYVPYEQRDSAARGAPILFARGKRTAAELVPAVRRTLQTMVPDLPFAGVSALDTEIAPQLRPWRLGVTMFGTFGGIGLALAVLGLSGVLAFRVSQRTREIGVRMALGARPAEIRTLVLGQGLRLAGLGLVIGLVAAIGLGRLIAALLYDVSPHDVVVLATAAGTVLLVAAVASYLPARRATLVDPLEAVRDD